MTVRINGISAREVVVAANRAGIRKVPVANLIRFAAEISGKALSQQKGFDWQAGLARMQKELENQFGPLSQVVTAALVQAFMGQPVTQTPAPATALDMRAGLEGAARRFAEGGEQFRLPNEEEITTIVDDPAEADSDGGNCD